MCSAELDAAKAGRHDTGSSARQRHTAHNAVSFKEISVQTGDSGVYTHTWRARDRHRYFSVLHLTPRMSVVFISFLPVSVYPSFIPYLHLPTHPWIRPLIFQCSFWVNSVWVNDAFHLCLSFLRPGAWSRLALTLGKQTREFQPDLLVTLELGTLNWVEGFDRPFCLEFWTNYD